MIDFVAESKDVWEEVAACTTWPTKCQEPEFHLEEWARSIAARVEEETILRLHVECTMGHDDFPRLYAPTDTRDTKRSGE